MIVSAALLATCIPQYVSVYEAEKAQNELLQETLDATTEIAGEGTVILTDLAYIDWTVADYYYPEAEHLLLSTEEVPVLEQDKTYWLMALSEAGPELTAQFESQGYSLTTIVENGTLGTNPVTVYKLEERIQ